MNKSNTKIKKFVGILTALTMAVGSFSAQADLPSEGPRLGDRLFQSDVLRMSLDELRFEGRRIFSTPFNFKDGLGDGPNDLSEDPTALGGRPSLEGSSFLLRFNGKDSQTCLACHSVLSNASIPQKFTVGGVGGLAAAAYPGIINPDIDDDGDNGTPQDDGIAGHTGRVINPPFNFGSGGVELLAKEMTADLQDLIEQAIDNPGTVVNFVAKGVNFGSISADNNGLLDTSNVVGINPDGVVRPFGRKGCCFSVRDFDRGALQFHHGMQPVEVVGSDIDADGDGVANEILEGELSAMHIFQVALERPRQKRRKKLNGQEKAGKTLFTGVGCAGCHIPEMSTNSKLLPLASPEIATDPSANVYMYLNLASSSAGFKSKRGGVKVQLFADLKTHNMGPGMAESTGAADAAFFQTARLWGVADTAPYLHDGRALTLSQAILAHGGEAQGERDAFDALDEDDQEAVVAFLRTLHTPKHPSADLR